MPDILFHPAAEQELAAAVDWYRERSERAAALFVDEISGTVDRIRISAAQFPHFTSITRRALLPRFPCFLVFRETHGAIQVLAVAHAKRRPGYWQRRVVGE
jgi:plasmid stabilization system protein ParE